MKFFNQLGMGYKSYYDAVMLIIKHNLYWYFAFPVALAVGVYYLGSYLDSFQYDIFSRKNLNDLDSINGLTWLIIKSSFWTTLAYLALKFTKYLVVIILSPIIAILSETVESILTGNKYAFNLKQLIHDVIRGIKISTRNMFWEYIIFTCVLIIAQFFSGSFQQFFLTSIPLVFGFYFYGFGFIDFINERRRLNISQSVYFVKKNMGFSVAIGSVYSLLFLVPFVGVVLSPILAIVAATCGTHEIVDLNTNEYAVKEDNKHDVSPETSEGTTSLPGNQ